MLCIKRVTEFSFYLDIGDSITSFLIMRRPSKNVTVDLGHGHLNFDQVFSVSIPLEQYSRGGSIFGEWKIWYLAKSVLKYLIGFISFPKILKCGHTFCSPCLIKLLQENPRCPNCRAEVKEIESSLPVNYYIALKAVDFYKSKYSSEKVVDTATEVAKRKDIILKKKTQMTLNVKILDKCLAKLEELTVSQSERIDTVNARKILDEIDEDLKKTDDVVRSDVIKSSISILLSSFEEDPEQFLLEIYKRLQNGEKVFAVHKINEEFKYGEVSFFSNQLFFHSLSLSKVPKDSSLIWFEDVKQCLNYKSFCTFIKICCNEKNLCTGECGPSYKGSLFKKGYNKSINSYDDLINVFSVEKRIENEK
ncbi:hypothetical protein Avbf_17511 [Armadillidium vulgare]|nr:hypothetical protein Avbf_17511 [Armadillidium vulgare]